jgi:hypothetical protein
MMPDMKCAAQVIQKHGVPLALESFCATEGKVYHAATCIDPSFEKALVANMVRRAGTYSLVMDFAVNRGLNALFGGGEDHDPCVPCWPELRLREV